MILKEDIRNAALGLGFSTCGFADANYDPTRHGRLVDWLGRNLNAEMKYMERNHRQRFDPRVHLPNAKSVIVCSMNYYSEPHYDPSKAYISLYARGEDYHKVIQDKLDSLGQIIHDRIKNVTLKSFVDSAPFAEKSWAAKAGLGYIGKNDLMIVFSKTDNNKRKSLGSFHFLGVLITDHELEPDSRLNMTCGKCRKCVEACPTGAILEDRFIDANKCNAYYTLSHKGPIVPDMAKHIGNNVYGCDLCQLACPHNKNLASTSEPRFAPDPGMVDINIGQLANLNEDEFENRFGKRSIGEKGFDIFKRNIEIVGRNLDISK